MSSIDSRLKLDYVVRIIYASNLTQSIRVSSSRAERIQTLWKKGVAEEGTNILMNERAASIVRDAVRFAGATQQTRKPVCLVVPARGAP